MLVDNGIIMAAVNNRLVIVVFALLMESCEQGAHTYFVP